MGTFTCYLCGGTAYKVRPGHARDNAELKPLECLACGLVCLSDFSHIEESFYENSHMRDSVPCDQNIINTVSDEDNARRFHDFYPIFAGKALLDFGCGDGGFLALAGCKAGMAWGIEPDKGWKNEHTRKHLKVAPSLSGLPHDIRFDIITMFHVLEHIADPLPILHKLRKYFINFDVGGGGKLLVEVPNADDALLTLYENEAFTKFTYWSCHLYLYNQDTLPELLHKAGFETLELRQYQRYPLTNHLHWLAKGQPGGQTLWQFLHDDALNASYARALAKQGKCDTIIGVFSV